MLPDETCWFLATDFDKKSWKRDVVAFRDMALLQVPRRRSTHEHRCPSGTVRSQRERPLPAPSIASVSA
jgi:hypothetical protein